MNRKWVLTVYTCEELFCEGVFDNYYEAVGKMMSRIWEFSESYKDDGDEFEIGNPILSETDGESEKLIVKYRSHSWKESECEVWNILSLDEQTERSGE